MEDKYVEAIGSQRVGKYVFISLTYIFFYELSNIIAQNLAILSPDPRFSSPWYPPAALTIVILFCYGLRYFLAVLMGQYILALVIFGFPPIILLPATIIPVGYLGIAYVGRRILDINLKDLDIKSASKFITLILIGTFVTGTVYNLVLLVNGVFDSTELLRWILNYSIGDSIGIIVFTPMIVEILKVTERRIASYSVHDSSFNSILTVVKDRYFLPIFLLLQFIVLIVGYLYTLEIDVIYFLFVPLLVYVFVYNYMGSVIAIFLVNAELIIFLSVSNVEIDGLLTLQLFMFIISATGLIIGLILRERIEIKDELAELEEILNQSQNLENIGRLTTGIVHDFNNILHGINVQTTLLGELSDNREVLDVVENIEMAIDRANLLVGQINSIHSPSSPKLQIIDLEREINLMLSLLRSLVKQNQLLFDNQSTNSKIIASKSQIQQILLNLIVNARDAIGENGTITLTLQNTIQNNLEFLELEVKDDGPGISEEMKKRIFEPYFSRKEIGTGLGLSIVEGIVNQIGGEIFLYDNVPHGARFIVRFQLAGNGNHPVE